MKRTSPVGAVLFWCAAAVAASAAGCTAIVGVGDYAVGSSPSSTDGSMEDVTSEGGGGEGSSGIGPQEGGGETGPVGHEGGDAPLHGDAMGHIGDPCTKSTDCTAGASTCNGKWCTRPCTSNFACGSSSTGSPNFCVQNGVASSCAPGCAMNSDCTAYPGTVCRAIAGGTDSACALLSTPEGGTGGDGGTGIIGDPCNSNADCMVGTCIGGPYPAGQTGWCEKGCASATDTSCGANTIGVTNVCLQSGATGNPWICFPGCSSNLDCTAFSGTTCQPVTGADGGATTTLFCGGTFGDLGDPCSSATNSPWGSSPTNQCGGATGATCNGAWCSETCTSDSACGKNSAGVSNYCITATSSTMVCFPGCTTANDCSVYTSTATGKSTFCEPINGRTTGNVCTVSGGLIGDPCAKNVDCGSSSGTCLGNWCSPVCTTDANCGTNTAGKTNRCVPDTSGVNYCFAGCASDADCLAYGGAFCQQFTGVAGMVCSF